ncbi:unnamed protein product [Nesidiocoris tenuis]|uniref:Uncharacterized protein n=1 Tax=Nesidiocoris tenuis TaxID=355587 RepID=A0A6H5GQC9_9HEMI|nr:unnamed protein product [Nesidiocoris tenuis]
MSGPVAVAGTKNQFGKLTYLRQKTARIFSLMCPLESNRTSAKDRNSISISQCPRGGGRVPVQDPRDLQNGRTPSPV